MQFGRGSTLNGVTQSFEQGALENTANATDMAIDGSGFFIVNDGTGNYYTRAGQFRLDSNGVLADPNSNVLQGYAITSGTTATSLSDVDLTGVQSTPTATTEFTLGANLDSSTATSGTFTSPITIYNSVGDEDVLSMTFTKASGNNWTWSATSSILSSSGSLASGTVSFDTSGALSSPTTEPTITLDYTSASSPAASQTITWDLLTSGVTNGELTGYAASSNNNSVVQDGHSTGTLIGLSVDTDGIISGLFDNGQTQQLYQVGLADFLSPEGLNRVGQNLFSVSSESGQPVIGVANTGGFGSMLVTLPRKTDPPLKLVL